MRMKLRRSRARAGRWSAFISMAVVGAGLLSPPIAAQVITGSVVEDETGAPLTTAVVTLLNVEGQDVARTVSDSRGHFSLRAPGPGTYRVRAERIGRAPVEFGPIQVTEGDVVRVDLRAHVRAISLIGIEVTADRRCHISPYEGAEMGRVWDQARLALQVEALTRTERAFRFRLSNYVRELTPDARWVTAEQARPSRGYMNQPYLSAPIEELLSEGWIRTDPQERGWVFFAPDAGALLSDEFLDAHCFHLVAHEDDPDLLGLGFQPVHRGATPGIEGALWLDRSTARLDHLSFRYTNLPDGVAADVPIPSVAQGGRVGFLELPNGIWVVSHWHIRMPLLEESRWTYRGGVEERVILVGIREEGGEITEVRRVGGEVVFHASQPARSEGVAPPDELVVQRFCSAPPGLDEGARGVTTVRVDPGLVEGSVTRREGGALQGFTVALREGRVTLRGSWEGGVIEVDTRETTTVTDGRGWYRVCARPRGGWDGLPMGHFQLHVRSPQGDQLYRSSIDPSPSRVFTHHVVIP